MESLKNPIILKMLGRERGQRCKIVSEWSFSVVFSKIWLETPSHKSVAMETLQDLDHQLYKLF